MLEDSIPVIIRNIKPSDKVLDIGGWGQPFRRANYIVDLMPYESRGVFGSIGSGEECYTKETWILHDVCSGAPLPFTDKHFDYVTCSHVLEDIRDPLFLCSEMIRIAKRGYIECPSRKIESTMGVEGKHYAGYAHHRWLVEQIDDCLTFIHKSHLLHESWKYHLPSKLIGKYSEQDKVTCLFWEETFDCSEKMMMGWSEILSEYKGYVRRQEVYHPFLYILNSLLGDESRLDQATKEFLCRHPGLKRVIESVIRDRINIPDYEARRRSMPIKYSRYQGSIE